MMCSILYLTLSVTAITAFAQDFKDIGIKTILKNSQNEIEEEPGNLILKNPKVSEIKILGWYREKAKLSELPGVGWCRDKEYICYLDCALVWSKVSTSDGQKWVIIQMVRNPIKSEPKLSQLWKRYFVFDGDDGIAVFDKPPTLDEITKSISNYKFRPDAGWTRFDSFVDKPIWLSLVGDVPPAP